MYLSLFRANCKLSVTKTCGLPSHLTSSNADPHNLGPDLCQIVANPITVIKKPEVLPYFHRSLFSLARSKGWHLSARDAVFEHLSSERSLDTYPTRIKSISLTKFWTSFPFFSVHGVPPEAERTQKASKTLKDSLICILLQIALLNCRVLAYFHYSNFVQEKTLTVTCLFELSFNVSFRDISCIQLWLSLVQTFQTRNQCWENFQVNHGTVAFSRHLSELKSWLLHLGWSFRLSVSLELFLARKSYAATKSCPYFSK